MGTWTCACGHEVWYDGAQDAVFSLRQKDNSGRLLLFTRSVCDELLSFLFYARSTYAAATAHFSATKQSFAFCRQYINLLGRLFVATLQPCPDAFKCPRCKDHPEYIIIDGQSLGFRRRPGMRILRPALSVPVLPIDVDLLCILPTATLRRAVRKILRCSEKLTRKEDAALRCWTADVAGIPGARGCRRRRRRPNDSVFVAAGQLFFAFFPHGADNAAEGGSDSEAHSSSYEQEDDDEPRPIGGLPDDEVDGASAAAVDGAVPSRRHAQRHSGS